MVHKWISVKKQLPPNDDAVLVANGLMYEPMPGRPLELFYSIYITSFTDDLRRDCKTITHWMPLPKPPKIDV